MFGYLTADTGRLTPEALQRYNSCYCGLCRTLARRHGLIGRMTLTYDMTFLVMLLSSLYEPEENSGTGRCPAHPLRRRQYYLTRYSDYAADLNVLLAWWNCRDDWEDEHRIDRLFLAALLKRRCLRVMQKYPRQSDAISRCLADIHRYETGSEVSADRAADAFGTLMGELFVENENDFWAPTLRQLGAGLGRFIYITDACIDYADDLKKHRPNPLRSLTDGPRDPMGDYDLLRLLLSDAAKAFEYLPLEQDVDIMRNILYSGVWTGFARAFRKELSVIAESDSLPSELTAAKQPDDSPCSRCKTGCRNRNRMKT